MSVYAGTETSSCSVSRRVGQMSPTSKLWSRQPFSFLCKKHDRLESLPLDMFVGAGSLNPSQHVPLSETFSNTHMFAHLQRTSKGSGSISFITFSIPPFFHYGRQDGGCETVFSDSLLPRLLSCAMVAASRAFKHHPGAPLA